MLNGGKSPKFFQSQVLDLDIMLANSNVAIIPSDSYIQYIACCMQMCSYQIKEDSSCQIKDMYNTLLAVALKYKS